MNQFRSVASATLAFIWLRGNRPKNAWLTVCLLLSALTAQAVDRDWNGSVSTNWNVAANWTPAGIPAAGDVLEVGSIPDNQPVILSGTMAKATRITVYYGASLTISSGGELELASPLANTALGITGTVTNNGTLKIKSGFHGIDSGDNAVFINNGIILLGEASSSPYAFTEEGIRMNANSVSNFTNNSAGSITIRRPGNNGILLFQGSVSFTNYGQITVEEAGLNTATEGTADGIDARRGTFTNETSGVINISKIKASGLNCRASGAMNNKGSITISEVGLSTLETIQDGLNNSGTFTNAATGTLTIDKTDNNGILNNFGGTIHNYGQILLGTLYTNSIPNVGLGNLAAFNNYNGAVATIKNAKTGILSGGLGGLLTNYASATVNVAQIAEDGIIQFGIGGTNNFGILNIGRTGNIGRYGINNACQFINQFGATTTIVNSANSAIINDTLSGISGSIQNVGRIIINNASNVGGHAINNKITCTIENKTCVSLIQITSDNTINNTGTFTNEGNLIENGSGNSSITNNSGTIQNLNGGTFSVTGSSTGVNSTATGTIWTGCYDTNWANASNWNGLAIPLATHDVTIPDLSNAPTIFGSTAAVAKSVAVLYDATLTLNNGSSLTISGSTVHGLHNKGTVENAGLLSISTTGAAGLVNEGSYIPGPFTYFGGIFNNNSGGEVRINDITNEAIYIGNAKMNNFAKINIGNTGNIGTYGINLASSTFDNKNTGEIKIDNTTNAGIFNLSGTLTNQGKITMGSIGPIADNGIVSSANISNEVGGEMRIDRTTLSGVYNSFGTFHNKGLLKIGSSHNIGGAGLSCERANFINYTSGEVTIDRTANSGIHSYYGASNKSISNSGKIFIGQTAAIGGSGILNYAIFDNNADSEITINRTTNSGISVFNDNDANTSPAVFNNAGKITLGNIASLGDNGIQNRMTFNNNAGGQILIDRSTSDGVFNAVGTFNNAGKLDIGATSAPTGEGLENAAAFNNQACGEIRLFDNLKNDGTFTNTGLLRMNTALAHTNSSTFTNDGIIEYPQGSLIPNVTNNDVIVKAVTGECPVANALQIGGTNSFTIGTTWYKDLALTMPAGTYNQAANAFTVSNLPEGSTNTLYFTVSDGANSCTRTVSIRLTYDDVTLPTLVCPANKTLNTNDDGGADCNVTLTYTVTFSDNCDGTGPATYVSGPLSGTSLHVNGSPYTVTYTYTDSGNNKVANDCVFTVTVKDNTNPTFTCPTPPLVLNTTGAAGCSVNIPNLVDMVTDEADNCVLRSFNPVLQSIQAGAYTGASHNETIPVTVTVLDNATPANTTTCTITFTVRDDDAPTINCPQSIVRNTDANQCSAVVSYAVPGYSDNCSGAVLQQTAGLASGATFPKGINTVAWKVTDAAGTSATCQFTVTVADTDAPALTCPANIIRSTDPNQCTAVVTYSTPTATDNCGTPTVTLSSPANTASGTAFPKGTTTVIWQATDSAIPANTTTCSFTITVNDTQLPNITCPANLARGTDPGVCTAAVTYNLPTYADNCPGAGLDHISGGTSGSTFPKGTTTVVWMVSDASNNTRTCSFRIIVNDAQAPTFTSCPSNQALSTAAGTCASAPLTYATPTATDNCGTVTVVRIGGPVSGSNFPAGNTVVTWRAIDGSNRSSTCTFTVTVTDNEPPTINCPSAVVTTGSGTPCTATAFYATPTASDNCAGTLTPFLVSGLSSGSNYPAGITTNVWRAVTPSGQSSECTFTVMVNCPGSRANVISSIQGKQNISDVMTLSLAPNPAKETVRFVVSGLEENTGNLIVLDALGRIVWQQALQPDQIMGQFDVSGWSAGVYQVCIRTNTQAITKALVVSD